MNLPRTADGRNCRTSDIPSVLLVTDEPFLPVRNGSARVYYDAVSHYMAAGWSVYCISFCRSWAQSRDRYVVEKYQELFGSNYLLLPGARGNGSVIHSIGYIARELDRVFRGNVFGRNPFLHSGHEQRVARDWFGGISFERIDFHKLHSALLMGELYSAAKAKRRLFIHDDFIERELSYRRVYSDFLRRFGLFKGLSCFPTGAVRQLIGRVSKTVSARVERAAIVQMDEVIVSTSDDFNKYSEVYGARVALQCWPLPPTVCIARDNFKTYDIGFIGSDDVMNVDAVLAFFENVYPKLQCKPKVLVAGAVASLVSRIIGYLPEVYYCGNVSTVSEFYGAVKVVAVPLRFGTGVSIKVLEALAHGAVVICTRVGARGVAGTGELHVAEDWDDFAALVQQNIIRV